MRWLLGAFAVLFKSVFFLNLFEKVTFLNPEKKIKPNMFCPYLSLVLAFFPSAPIVRGQGGLLNNKDTVGQSDQQLRIY